MLILAIETSCDETSLALIEASGGLKKPKFTVVKNIIASQIETHRPWGGVVPNLAKREHLINLPVIFRKINLPTSQGSGHSAYKLKNLKLISVTIGPGLEPCLWTGIEFAKKLKKEKFPGAKIIGVNHLHGHFFSFLLPQKKLKNLQTHKLTNFFPAIQLIASGGHTILVLMKSLTKWQKLGETRDDAAGEAFDKTARMLDLPYPGGPEIEKLAEEGDPKAINFPRPMLHSPNYDFSFSGLKTAVLYYIRDLQSKNLDQKNKADIAASFQEAAIRVLAAKTAKAAKEYGTKTIILSGGVAANLTLRKTLRLTAKNLNINFLSAEKKFQGDNAAMIAVAGYIQLLAKKSNPLKAQGGLSV